MSKARYVTGLRAVEQMLQSRTVEIRKIYAEYRSANPRVQAVLDRARDAGLEVQSANRARLRQISGEARHQGVIAEIKRHSVLDEAALRTRVEERLGNDEGRSLLLLVLDGIQDPHNLGACMRTADAAGVDAVVTPRHGAAGLGPTVSKVAAGAAEVLPFAQVANIGRMLDWLGEYGVVRIGTSDQGSEVLYDIDATGPAALVMGREEKGLSPAVMDRCDHLAKLPMAGHVSSLNVSVATGVCLYETVRQRRANPASQASS
jgi:23S rRNA (guanosine2251-2'-O)-methyltransferase